MRVLIDQNDRVWARGGRYVREALAKRERWADRLTLREEWLPDDTVFERTDNGAFVIAAEQPDGWASRRTTEQRVIQFMRESKELLENATIPDEITGRQAATYFKEVRKILLGHHMIIEKLLKDSRNG